MSLLSRRRPPTLRGAALAMAAAACVLALAGYLVAVLWPSPYELVAFVQSGTLEQNAVVPKADILERLNGLSTASEVARQLDRSPWLVWRRYSVTAEGPIYVVRVQDTDLARATQLIDVVRETLVRDLKQRYDLAMAPHRTYLTALEEEVARLAEETARIASQRAVPGRESSSDAADRWVALAQIRKEVRDAQVFVALSEVPSALGDVRRRDPVSRDLQVRLALTGAVVGIAAAAVAVIILAFRARSAHAFAGG